MTPSEGFQRFLEAIERRDVRAIVDSLDPEDLERWRTQELFHAATSFEYQQNSPPEPTAEAGAAVLIWDTSRAPELLAKYRERRLPALPGNPTFAEIQQWRAPALLTHFLESRFAEPDARGQASEPTSLRIIGEVR